MCLCMRAYVCVCLLKPNQMILDSVTTAQLKWFSFVSFSPVQTLFPLQTVLPKKKKMLYTQYITQFSYICLIRIDKSNEHTKVSFIYIHITLICKCDTNRCAQSCVRAHCAHTNEHHMYLSHKLLNSTSVHIILWWMGIGRATDCSNVVSQLVNN